MMLTLVSNSTQMPVSQLFSRPSNEWNWFFSTLTATFLCQLAVASFKGVVLWPRAGREVRNLCGVQPFPLMESRAPDGRLRAGNGEAAEVSEWTGSQIVTAFFVMQNLGDHTSPSHRFFLIISKKLKTPHKAYILLEKNELIVIL